MIFKNREEAGTQLAERLHFYHKAPKTIVIGLPRGGVVVASVIAKKLQLPLDVIVPRKIGAPHNPELAIGAIAGDVTLLDSNLIADLSVSPAYLDQAIAKERKEAERRLSLFRKNKPPQNLAGLTILLIDDGIATGSTMRASIAYLKKIKVKKIVVAVPVGPPDTIADLNKLADEVICLYTPSSFMAVGQFYIDFPQTEDTEVISLLK